MNRRTFLSTSAAAVATLALARPAFGKKAGSDTLTHKQRVDRALRGQDLDRPPFTFYHHYKRPTAQLEAQDHLEFHRTYNTDIVKVMNDFDYPQSTTGKWYELKPLNSPFPEQLTTLKLIRDGLNGDAYFIDTIYGPYMTAMILFQSQPEYAKLGNSRAETMKITTDALRDSIQHGLDHRAKLLKELPTRDDFDLEDYLMHKLDFNLNEDKKKALYLFLEYIKQLG